VSAERMIWGEYGLMSESDVTRFWQTGNVIVRQVGHWRCWEYTHRHDHRGYGRFWLNGQYRPAHRVLYGYINPRTFKLRRASLDIDEQRPHLDHLCNNRACVRRNHVRPVTPRGNHQARSERYWRNKLRRTVRSVRFVHPLFGEELI